MKIKNKVTDLEHRPMNIKAIGNNSDEAYN